MLEFFGLESWTSGLTALVLGAALGFIFGFVPGLGGRIGTILCLPLAPLFEPYEAAIFFFSMRAVVDTSGAIPNIAFGIPSSASDMATIIDGYPLAKMGRAGEALGASLSASAIGGLLGALAFLLSIPIAKPLVTSFGPPEILLLAIFGITMVASLSREGLITGLIVASLGLLVSTVGIDSNSGDPRFTFGSIALWDGISLPAIVCGFYVIPEMLSLRALEGDSYRRAATTSVGDVFRGMFVTLNHLRVVFRSSIYGIFVGFMPAVGTSIGAWMSYDYAARTTKSEIPFGQGAVAGVIAPEAANNAEEGGAMIPTLFFGIPGSASMAIMIGALTVSGVTVGPNMLDKDIGLSYALAAAVCLANLIAIPLFFLAIPSLIRLSSIRRDAIIPFAIAVSLTSALVDTPSLLTLVIVGGAALLGIALKLANWPRAPFIVGYVIGGMAEDAYHQTLSIYGWSALQRPLVIIFGIALIVWIIYSLRLRPVAHVPGHRLTNIVLAAGLAIALIAVALLSVETIRGASRVVPLTLAVLGAALSVLVLIRAISLKTYPEPEEVRFIVPLLLFLIATPVFGVLVSGFFFVLAVLIRIGIRWPAALLSSFCLLLSQYVILALIFDVIVEREFIGRIAWSLMDY